MTTIKIDNYTLKISKKETRSNCNTFAHVYKDSGLMPEFGTTFQDTTPRTEIVKWAKVNIEKIEAKCMLRASGFINDKAELNSDYADFMWHTSRHLIKIIFGGILQKTLK